MRAVRFHGRGDIRIDQIEEPVCQNDQVKIRPAFVGICGSDLHEYLAGPSTVPQTPHPITNATLPVTLGHEFSGIIEEVGPGVTRVKVGDRVAVKPNLYDGTCARCVQGRVNCCRNLGFIGYSSNSGGLSDHVVVQEERARLLPNEIPLDIGGDPRRASHRSLACRDAQPRGNSSHCARRRGRPHRTRHCASASGPRRRIYSSSEVSERRRRFAETLGATDVLDPRTEDIEARVRSLSCDAGADISFECSGVQAGFDTALKGVRARGTVTVVSLWEQKPVIDAWELVGSEKHIIGSAIFDGDDFEAVIDAIASGKLKPQSMITSKIRMEEIVEQGFEALINERDKHVKILIDVSA
ncbi:alcohol dehydrogenase [Aspergillus nomiae NRRL 13137]|uniref:Alcohol dehydrogenase n=1 Tax=Aspergillus nomiae NRRL (strain ATCC 15546 / NRRL 13137 / CBS 260.88 / M93) TaxID=1509407 RepID=A0A0L1JAA5_ASPN3|nr:alcohol dehydrogenase [Aspergillus nomiae NRRL 13137]KNG88630.1 alcohol dehydrogenase [Aspergillus nomiae NRRL 13137]